MKKVNLVERINYSGWLLGFLFASSRGKLQDTVEQRNNGGWNLHIIHPDNPNIFIVLLRLLVLILTAGLWTIGSSELLIFEKEDKN